MVEVAQKEGAALAEPIAVQQLHLSDALGAGILVQADEQKHMGVPKLALSTLRPGGEEVEQKAEEGVD